MENAKRDINNLVKSAKIIQKVLLRLIFMIRSD
nr:MAG TPA: hypothetical protein [Caudoviricetes sp.]